MKRNKEAIYNENQISNKINEILEEKVSNKIQQITDEHKIQEETIAVQSYLIRNYKCEISELRQFKELAEVNKLKIAEFQKEIENLKISHGNPA